MSHTEGAWFYEGQDRGAKYCIRFKAPHYTGRGEIMAKGIERIDDARLLAASPLLLDALRGILHRYVELVNCGDCGNWNPETETEVIKARFAIAKATT